ncbi:MAG: SPRY domain-containing protein, partial [Anaerolineales bacterium]|nr:SPRY domain-containing protein [Anaerolineales bacterium]
IGADNSGNTNDFTPTNLVATDQVLDSPTNNFATLNPLSTMGTSITIGEGNLYYLMADDREIRGTFAMFPGTKWYWEYYNMAGPHTDYAMPGIADPTDTSPIYHSTTNGVCYYGQGYKYVGTASASSYGATFTLGDIIGIALNLVDDEITFYKNGVSQGVITGIPTPTAGLWVPAITNPATSAGVFNFGQDSSFAGNKTAQGNQDGNDKGDFYYPVPAGYLAMCTDNLADPEIALPTKHRDTLLWTGAASNPGAARTISGLGFEPEFFFQACRAGGGGGARLTYDVLRGFGNDKELCLDSQKAEGVENADEYGYVSAVTSTGITYSPGSLGYGDNVIYYDTSGATFVSWVWKAGGTPTATNSAGAGNVPTAGSAKVNGSNSSAAASGSIPLLKQSANTTSGFSMTTFAGTGATATLGHGLSQRPDAFVVKNLNVTAGGGYDWLGWTVGLPGAGYILNWNTPGSSTADSSIFTTNNPPCDSSVIHLGSHAYVNSSGSTNILYAWHSVDGYSKIGTYEGNTSTNGPFIYTGFRPSFVWIKCIDTGYAWFLNDNKRDPYNEVDENIATEATSGATTALDKDFVSNGFKIRTSAGGNNDANTTYWYMAFAESPFKTSNAR